MPLYFYFFLFIVLSIIIIVIRAFIIGKNNAPTRLFAEALKNENGGHFEEALTTYEAALTEVKKVRFNNKLKNKIIEKLKLLHTVIAYENSFHFTR